MNKTSAPPAVSHVEMAAQWERDKQRRAPYWIGAGFGMFALIIVIFMIGGGEWLKPCAPLCLGGGVVMIALGAWSKLPSRQSRIINLIATPTITVAILIAVFIAT